MPRINVNERDLSWYYRQRQEGSAVVYIPGLATFGPSDEPVLVNSGNFTNVFGLSPVELPGDEVDYSYEIAKSYIKSGFDVLFHRFLIEGSAAASVNYDSKGAVKFSAKYPGTFGNNLVLVVRSTTTSTTDTSLAKATVFVYVQENANTKTLVETNTVDFKDQSSVNYYKFLDSEYIKISRGTSKDEGQVESELPLPEVTKPEMELKLSVGLDYGKGTENVLDLLRTAIAGADGTGTGALANLEDPYQYDFDIIDSCGLPECKESDTIDKVDKVLVELAEKRGTAIYFVNGASSWDYTTMYTYCSLFDTSFAVGCGPWGYAQLVGSGKMALLPGSYPVIVAWAQSCASGNPLWLAPAGVKRASLNSFYKGTSYVVGKTVLDQWQNHQNVYPGAYKVNPIMKVKQYGYVVYGNSTLLHTRGDGATSVLQTLSTRVTANLIKREAFLVSLKLQFDQLTMDVFTEFKVLLGRFMDQLMYTKALYDYQITLTKGAITSVDMNEKTLPITIKISPNMAVENFEINLEISKAGVSFSEDGSETELG